MAAELIAKPRRNTLTGRRHLRKQGGTRSCGSSKQRSWERSPDSWARVSLVDTNKRSYTGAGAAWARKRRGRRASLSLAC